MREPSLASSCSSFDVTLLQGSSPKPYTPCAEDFSNFVTQYLGGERIRGPNGEDTYACNVFLCRPLFAGKEGVLGIPADCGSKHRPSGTAIFIGVVLVRLCGLGQHFRWLHHVCKSFLAARQPLAKKAFGAVLRPLSQKQPASPNNPQPLPNDSSPRRLGEKQWQRNPKPFLRRGRFENNLAQWMMRLCVGVSVFHLSESAPCVGVPNWLPGFLVASLFLPYTLNPCSGPSLGSPHTAVFKRRSLRP